jgi:hypothetical protein
VLCGGQQAVALLLHLAASRETHARRMQEARGVARRANATCRAPGKSKCCKRTSDGYAQQCQVTLAF